MLKKLFGMQMFLILLAGMAMAAESADLVEFKLDPQWKNIKVISGTVQVDVTKKVATLSIHFEPTELRLPDFSETLNIVSDQREQPDNVRVIFAAAQENGVTSTLKILDFQNSKVKGGPNEQTQVIYKTESITGKSHTSTFSGKALLNRDQKPVGIWSCKSPAVRSNSAQHTHTVEVYLLNKNLPVTFARWSQIGSSIGGTIPVSMSGNIRKSIMIENKEKMPVFSLKIENIHGSYFGTLKADWMKDGKIMDTITDPYLRCFPVAQPQ